jgi:hypothetical protein
MVPGGHGARGLRLVKFLSRALTALNFDPSIATLAIVNRSSLRHSTQTSAFSHSLDPNRTFAGSKQLLNIDRISGGLV